jgi:hypothetical protein
VRRGRTCSTAILAPDPHETTSLEVRLQYLHRRRRAYPRRAVAMAAMTVLIVWLALLGLSLFLR